MFGALSQVLSFHKAKCPEWQRLLCVPLGRKVILMSITPEEAAYEDWYSNLADEISEEAISEFSTDLLKSYYQKYPNVAQDAYRVFYEASALTGINRNAALVLHVTSIELALKVALLKPVVYGLVHNSAVAELIADLVVRQNGLDRFKKLLSKILNIYGDIELDSFKIKSHKKTLWEEIAIVQKARNRFIHRGSNVSDKESELVFRNINK